MNAKQRPLGSGRPGVRRCVSWFCCCRQRPVCVQRGGSAGGGTVVTPTPTPGRIDAHAHAQYTSPSPMSTEPATGLISQFGRPALQHSAPISPCQAGTRSPKSVIALATLNDITPRVHTRPAVTYAPADRACFPAIGADDGTTGKLKIQPANIELLYQRRRHRRRAEQQHLSGIGALRYFRRMPIRLIGWLHRCTKQCSGEQYRATPLAALSVPDYCPAAGRRSSRKAPRGRRLDQGDQQIPRTPAVFADHKVAHPFEEIRAPASTPRHVLFA